MRPKTKLAVAAAALVLVCLAEFAVMPSPSPNGARLLADAELQQYLGGCNNSHMTTVPCTNPNNDCLNTSIICVPLKGKGVCWRWEPNPQGTCTGMEGWNCSCTSESEGCATQWEGAMVSGGCPKGCTEYRGTCGIVKTKCTSAPCQPGKD